MVRFPKTNQLKMNNSDFIPKNLFIGILHRKKELEWLNRNSKSGIQIAANNFQWNFIDGIERNNNGTVDVFSTLSMGSYPLASKKLIVFSKKHKRNQSSILKYIGYINFYFIKGFVRFFLLTIELIKWIRKNPNGTIFIYSLYTPYLFSLRLIRLFKKTNDIKICLIVPDLYGKYSIQPPLYSLKGLQHRLDSFFKSKLFKKLDLYVLLTKQMAKPLDLNDNKYVIVEGLIDKTKINVLNQTHHSNSKRIILYAGSLLKVFGIEMLLESFTRINNKNFELWICGPINESQSVLEFTQKDKRIKYLGFLEREELTKIRIKCHLLINPRPNKGEYVKYSFPSKTIEYMASGKPVLMFKLDGLPEDYYKYIYFIDKYNQESIAEAIVNVLSKSDKELVDFGRRASDFIIQNKNSQEQVRKILLKLNTKSNASYI